MEAGGLGIQSHPRLYVERKEMGLGSKSVDNITHLEEAAHVLVKLNYLPSSIKILMLFTDLNTVLLKFYFVSIFSFFRQNSHILCF